MEKATTYTNFGEHLRTLRENAGLTLREVASCISIDSSLLAKIEKNQRQPTKLLIKKVALFFDSSEKDLLTAFLSDQIAYKILDGECDLNVLKVAEQKLYYLKTHHNERLDGKE